MTCFQIAHHHRCKGVFTTIARKGKEYIRIRPKHPVCRFIQDALETRHVSTRRTRGRPPSTLSSSKDDDYDDFFFVGSIPATPATLAVHRTTQDRRASKNLDTLRNVMRPTKNQRPRRQRNRQSREAKKGSRAVRATRRTKHTHATRSNARRQKSLLTAKV